MANAGKRSGVSDKSNFPPSKNSGDFVVILSSSSVTTTPNFSSISTIFSSPCGNSPKLILTVRPSSSNTFAASNNARFEKSDGTVNVVGL